MTLSEAGPVARRTLSGARFRRLRGSRGCEPSRPPQRTSGARGYALTFLGFAVRSSELARPADAFSC